MSWSCLGEGSSFMAPRSWSVSRLHLPRCAVGSGLGWPMRRCTAARQAGGAGRDVDAVRLGCRQAVRLPSGSAHHDSTHSAAAPCWPLKAFRGPRPRRAPPPPLDPLLPRSCGLTTTLMGGTIADVVGDGGGGLMGVMTSRTPPRSPQVVVVVAAVPGMFIPHF